MNDDKPFELTEDNIDRMIKLVEQVARVEKLMKKILGCPECVDLKDFVRKHEK